jgi:archaemetzincin
MLGLFSAVVGAGLFVGLQCAQSKGEREVEDRSYGEIEKRLAPLATKLGKPQPGDWLFEHKEDGQSFNAYLASDPVRKSRRWHTLYLCLLGDFTLEQERIIDRTREYLEVFFDCPVKIHRKVDLADIPAKAKRVHRKWGDKQILSTYVLDAVLKPQRPDDALAYLAFTASDLFPEKKWNFVFGQASLSERTGVFSIYRNGDPAMDFELCLRRTLGTATHETGHMLSMQHCKVYDCSLNGSNNREESDSRPLHLCPTCLRKHCWNLRLEPVAYLKRLQKFCRKQGLADEAEWYRKAIAALKKDGNDD